MKRVALVAMAVSACSPFSSGAFHCAEDADCKNGDIAGYCEQPVGFCAFDDGACDSGRRFGASSGGVAGQCVSTDNLQPDAGSGDQDGNSAADADFTGCYGKGPLLVCPLQPLGSPLTVGAAKTYDTGAASPDCLAVRAPGATDVCVIGGSTVTISAPIFATGDRPFVIVSAGDLTVSGAIDASSVRGAGARIGAGALRAPSTCASGTIMAGGGGAGGSYGTKGGAGGMIEGNANQQTAGDPIATFSFGGGCPGHDGALGATSAGAAGKGGAGGGAIALIATGMLSVQANVSAVGEGGATGDVGTVGGGGGGGGAGGTILLDAANVMLGADVFANGGAGAEGNSAQTGAQGCNGGQSTGVTMQATVDCDFLNTAGNGGKGAAGNMNAGAGTGGSKMGNPGSGGGGGGGGGLGVIKIVSPNPKTGNGMLSPPAS